MEPVNFGTGREVSINEIANKVIEYCNSSVEPRHIEKRIGEVERLIAQPIKAYNLLSWVAEYSFDEGLKKYVEWYKQYGFEDRVTID